MQNINMSWGFKYSQITHTGPVTDDTFNEYLNRLVELNAIKVNTSLLALDFLKANKDLFQDQDLTTYISFAYDSYVLCKLSYNDGSHIEVTIEHNFDKPSVAIRLRNPYVIFHIDFILENNNGLTLPYHKGVIKLLLETIKNQNHEK